MSKTWAWLALLLGLFAAVQVGSLGRHLPGVSIELGERHLLHLQPELRELLTEAQSPLFATWYVSSVDKLPAERRSASEAVIDLLVAMRGAAPGRFDFAIVDPEESPDLAAYASKRRVSSFRAVSVRGDESTTGPIFSTLTLEQSGKQPSRIEHIGPEHLGDLQGILLERLRMAITPTKPRFTLARPAGQAADFDELHDALALRGEVRTVDFASSEGEELDLWSDVLFWMNPSANGALNAPQLERYLESGRSVILAGGNNAPGARSVFRELGLEIRPGKIQTEFGASTPSGNVAELVPSIAPDQDFRRLSGQPNGTLFFEAPGPFTFNADILDGRGVSARRIANSNEATVIEQAGNEQAAPKLALGVLLEPADARRGSLVAFAAATPFADGFYAMAGAAHRPLLTSLIDTFGGSDRRALLRAGSAPPKRLASFTGTERQLVRAALWAPLPLFLLGIYLWRRARQVTSQRRSGQRARPRHIAETAGVLSLLALAAWTAAARVGPRMDFTADGLNSPSPVTLNIAQQLADEGTLEARLYFSAPGKLDTGLANLPRRIHGLLDALAPTGLTITRSEVRPETLSESDYDALQARGIRAFRATRATSSGHRDGAAWASLELTFAGNLEVLSFQDAYEAEGLEFRLAFALDRLRMANAAPGSGQVRIGFASDLPRMSAAEDYEYQSKGSFAPREGDVFQLARAGLARAGFTVEHIDPRDPKIGQSAEFEHDTLVWLQPRRNTLPMMDALQVYLRKGGSALLAAQHFRTQARQYRGADFELVFWPQPQVPDVERFWLPEFGVNLVREVLFDKSSVTLPIDTRILGKGTELTFQPEPTRAPFLVRASAKNFNAESLIMRGVDDLALADPNWIRLDADQLAASGLTASVLFQGSAESWHANWQGGWLTDEMLGGPSTAPDNYTFEPNPALCVLVEGTFPEPKELGTGADGSALPFAHVDSADLAPGRLLFVGNSSFLNDSAIAGPEFRGDAFLLNAVAKLALEEASPHGSALAQLAGKRPVRRGFGLLAAKTKRTARVWVVFGGASVLAVFLLAWRVIRATRTPKTAAARPALGTATKRTSWSQRRAVAPAIAPILIAAVAFCAGELFANSLAESRVGGLRLGRLIGPDIRAHDIAALRITQGPGTAAETSWTWVHGTFGGGSGYDPQAENPPESQADLRGDPSGSWREITGAGALGDASAIGATITAMFDAEGIVTNSGLTETEAFGFNSATTWRVELFDYQTEPDHTKWGPALASIEIGTTSSDGLSAYLRAAGDPAIWTADTNPSARLSSRTALKFPPLTEARILPREWPGMQVGISAIAWQASGGSSLRLVSTTPMRTPEELQSGRSPVLWQLIGKGESTLMDDAPGENARGGAAAAEAFVDYLAHAEATELLDPARALEYGMGPDAQPIAIVLLESNPLPLPKGSPEAEGPRIPLMLRIGPALPPELGGGHAMVNAFSGNLLRVPAKFVELVLPAATDFESAARVRSWSLR